LSTGAKEAEDVGETDARTQSQRLFSPLPNGGCAMGEKKNRKEIIPTYMPHIITYVRIDFPSFQSKVAEIQLLANMFSSVCDTLDT